MDESAESVKAHDLIQSQSGQGSYPRADRAAAARGLGV